MRDHQRAGEVPPAYGSWSGAAPVNIPVISGPGLRRAGGGGRFSVGHAPSLFLSVLMLLHCIGHMPNTGRGDSAASESEVKTEQTLVLDGLPGPQFNFGIWQVILPILSALN
jgi:hypothetical protein